MIFIKLDTITYHYERLHNGSSNIKIAFFWRWFGISKNHLQNMAIRNLVMATKGFLLGELYINSLELLVGSFFVIYVAADRLIEPLEACKCFVKIEEIYSKYL